MHVIDTQWARMSWPMRLIVLAILSISEYRPVIMTAGRRARLEDAEKMVEWMAERAQTSTDGG